MFKLGLHTVREFRILGCILFINTDYKQKESFSRNEISKLYCIYLKCIYFRESRDFF